MFTGRGNADTMKSRQLGNTGPRVAEIGLGCMGMSWAYGPGDDDGSARTLHRALDLGIDLLDTADVYGAGRNQELIGRTLSGRRADLRPATKFGMRSRGGEARSDRPGWWRTPRSAGACSATETSLPRAYGPGKSTAAPERLRR